MGEKYSGSEWVESINKCDYRSGKTISPLGKKVADILGQAFRGIYHINKDILRADLSTESYIALTISGWRDWATFDDNLLTVLVVLCHDAGIRMEIQPSGPRYFRLLFHQRGWNGTMSKRMIKLDDHVKMIRDHYLLDEIILKDEE